ncbi:MAG: SLC13 family permease [Halobacteriales archaeon]
MRVPSTIGRLGRRARNADPSWLALPAGVVAALLALTVLPLAPETARMVAITLFAVSLWVGTPVPPWFTSLVALGLIGTAFSSELALVGFRAPATWLVVFGIVIGEATRASGVAELVERRAMARVPDRIAGDPVGTYRYLLVVLSFAGLAFAVLIPSSLVRVLILGPILISVGEVFEERRPKIGLFLGPLFATYYGAAGILTGSLANIIIVGIVEDLAGLAISWTEYALWLGPVMAVGRTLSIIVVAYVLYRPRNRSAAVQSPDPEPEGSVSAEERRMLGFLLVGAAIWATDSLHGLHPLYGALAVVLLAFAPRVGVVGMDVIEDADFTIIFFIGAVFAIAAGLQQTGFTDLAAEGLLSTLPGDASLPLVLVVVFLSAMVLSLIIEGLAVASVLTPTLVSFAEGAGVSLFPIALVEAVALNTYFFPHQSVVLVGILGLGMVEFRELVRMATLSSLATLLVLLPLQIAVFVAFL